MQGNCEKSCNWTNDGRGKKQITVLVLIDMAKNPRSRWQRLFNNGSNKLKTALRDLPNASFTAYVSSLKRDDYSIWKLLKSRKKPQTLLPPIRKNSTPPGPWAKSDSEKVELFATHLTEVFTPHDNTWDPDVDKKLATNTQHSGNLQA